MHPTHVVFSSHPGTFQVMLRLCQNPECECAELTFDFQEISLEKAAGRAPLAFRLRVDVENWQEVAAPPRSRQAAALVQEFLEEYPLKQRAHLQQLYQERKETARRLREYRIAPDLIAESALLAFGEIIAPDDDSRPLPFFLDHFEYGGTDYLVDDLYCPAAKCLCREVHLRFLQKDSLLSEETTFQEHFLVNLTLDGRAEIEHVKQGSRQSAETLWRWWWERNADQLEALQWRYDKVKQIARRSTPPPDPSLFNDPRLPETPAVAKTWVGRNTPCPCGSGKKFKRCCGRNKNHAGA